MSLVWSIVGFVIVMGLIVTIHEWGHYQVARWFDIKVLRFSIGFGKPVYQKQGLETEFVIGSIPLGGYVKFADEREEPVAETDLHRAFNRQSVYKRIAVVAAGPLINLLFAWLAFTLMFMVGVSGLKPLTSGFSENSPLQQSAALSSSQVDFSQPWFVTEINQQPVYSWQTVHQQVLQSLATDSESISLRLSDLDQVREVAIDKVSLAAVDINKPELGWLKQLGFIPSQPLVPAIVGQVVENSAAANAGLLVGDKILTIDKKPISNWQDFVKVVQANPQVQVEVEFERSQVVYQQMISIGSKTLKNGNTVGVMGVGVHVDKAVLEQYTVRVQHGFMEALSSGYQRSVDLVVMSLAMIKRMLIGEVSTDNLSGPISIAQFSGQAIQSGLVTFLSLLGLLSLSIGILNLLPIPVLDGGHLMFYLIEIVKGSPVSERVMVVGQTLGIMVIVGLTFLALFNDFIRISHG